ncbi:ABC transporter ATP-binding protein [Labrys wisconsinensis]|uniref:NitT/TauT family transport system ATP-binding protein n=1 Tax=Labrys wisconsinensis TaxID=425677 RepID=A0ABU0JIG3_9HYPH|nr:ABC transporter ATP-binding protein [Labrys wisconsinensis]MDQ0473415.1 NitT/TauT family transport system ATP-binding protein [Labrys wisconsinensis]
MRSAAAVEPATALASTRERMVQLEEATVRFPGRDTAFLALDRTSLAVDAGDFVAMVGPSGCGKSTILKLVAGLLRPTEGQVFVAGREVAARSVGVGMAFQNPTMLPWLSIRQNVMLPLKIVAPYRASYRAKKHTEYRDRAEALLAKVGLAGFGDHKPWQLSGGMLQRANLCRALIHEPKLLMLDEPFGALDQFTREELWSILQALWMDGRPTVFLVTHDLREAAFLATRILVMSARPGRVTEDRAVPFARPRTLDTTYEDRFTALTHDLRQLIAAARQGEGARP